GEERLPCTGKSGFPVRGRAASLYGEERLPCAGKSGFPVRGRAASLYGEERLPCAGAIQCNKPVRFKNLILYPMKSFGVYTTHETELDLSEASTRRQTIRKLRVILN
ncbi:MAG: hypothetical protein LBD79_11430, partial [Treponema sp.]|nr:hypothetical protein [Treponema sp.]